ncbi:MAG: copper chaperone [Bacteroidales bacterium]|jgi:Cu(I)/Ag(I) efflux system membrane fusion protein|nr:copper chaperone [Bacteroidales bacterium]
MKKVILSVIAMACMSIGSAHAQHSDHRHSQDTTVQSSKSEAKGTQATLKVQGACGMCKTRIEKAAKSTAGVSDARWDAKTQKLSITCSGKASPDAVAKAVAAVGHDTDKYKADDKVYNALPACCKYRK